MYYEVKKYNDNLYQLKDKLGVLSTLVIGDDKALVFDTCYGIGNLKEEVRKITDKELIVINSHGHMDHSCGNYQFDEVYIHPLDIELCKLHNNKAKKEENLKRVTFELPNDFDKEKYINTGYGNLKEINYGDVISLGNLDLEVINMRGHTKGSIGLYIKKWKLLLASDAACPFVWMFLKESTTVSEYIKMLEEVLKLDFDSFLVGHGAIMYDKERMYAFYNVAKNIDVNKSQRMNYFGFEDLEPYRFTLNGDESCGIVYDKNKL